MRVFILPFLSLVISAKEKIYWQCLQHLWISSFVLLVRGHRQWKHKGRSERTFNYYTVTNTLEEISRFWLAKRECSFHITWVQIWHASAKLKHQCKLQRRFPKLERRNSWLVTVVLSISKVDEVHSKPSEDSRRLLDVLGALRKINKYRPNIQEHLRQSPEPLRRLPKRYNDIRRLPKITRSLPKTFEHSNIGSLVNLKCIINR